MPDTTKDRSELVIRAAQKLLLIGSGQSLDSDDQVLIDGAVDATLADLAERGVCYIGNEEAIPVALFEWLAMCLANNVAEDFGKAMDPGKILFSENRLRVIGSTQPTYETLRADYY